MVRCSLLAEHIFRSPHSAPTHRYTILDSRLLPCNAISEGRLPLCNTSSEAGALLSDKPAFRDCITRGKHRVRNGVSRGKYGPRKTEKYFRLIMNRAPEYSHLVFIIPVYLRTITLSKSLVSLYILIKKSSYSWTI